MRVGTSPSPPRRGAVLVDAVRALDDADIVTLADLSLRRPSLDDVFLALTGHKSTPEEAEAETAAVARLAAGRGAAREHDDLPSPPRRGTCRRHPAAGAALTDGLTIARRNLLRILRTPQLVFFSTIQPIMFVLLFNYVFGGAIDPPADKYTTTCCPGSWCRPSCSAHTAAVGLATDMGTGIIDRFRSLPMARSAVLSGRTGRTPSATCSSSSLMIVVGTVIGFRFHGGLLSAVGSWPSCSSASPSPGCSPSSASDRRRRDRAAGWLRHHLSAGVRQLGLRADRHDAVGCRPSPTTSP